LDATDQQAGGVYYGTLATNVAGSISDTAAYKSNICLVTATVNWTNYSGHMSMGHTRQMQIRSHALKSVWIRGMHRLILGQ
jgi:hypothetical protein